MSLFKRGSVWWAYFYRDGIRYQSSTGTSSRRQAETIEAKFKEEVNNRRLGLVEADPKMTFGELAARFIASSSVKPYHIYHLEILLPFFADMPVVQMTKSLADEFRRHRVSEKPIKDATVNRDLSVLRHILYWALDERMLLTNPLARMKMVRERRTRRPVLSVAEEELLLAVAPEHLRGMIIAALDTGMRRGEITSQRWEDVDLAQHILFVTHSKTPEGESREIPLTNRLTEHLQAMSRAKGVVFEYHGEQIERTKTSWKSTLNRAGLRHMRFHDLRHTFNTRLMEAGVLQEIRMALMGHSSGSKIQAIYTHIELPTKRKAIAQLEAWIEAERKNASTANNQEPVQ